MPTPSELHWWFLSEVPLDVVTGPCAAAELGAG